MIEVQNRSGDGLTMSELDEGYAWLDKKRVLTLETLLPDTASFLAGISPEQVNILENKMIEHRDTLLYWDQDVLNMTIDDKYIELNKSLNFDL